MIHGPIDRAAPTKGRGRPPYKVTIVVPRSYPGFGDLMHPVALATSLPSYLSIRDISFVFEESEDIAKAKRIMSDFEDSANPWKIINGGVENGRAAIASSDICIKLPIGTEYAMYGSVSRPALKDFVTGSPLNIYLEEYDPVEQQNLAPKVPVELRGRGLIIDTAGYKQNGLYS